jgi:hypothetical protein
MAWAGPSGVRSLGRVTVTCAGPGGGLGPALSTWPLAYSVSTNLNAGCRSFAPRPLALALSHVASGTGHGPGRGSIINLTSETQSQ